jgi:hypothetical protein
MKETTMAHSHDGNCCERKLNRRDVLRRLGQFAMLPAALVVGSEARAATPVPLPGTQVNVFRLSPVPRGQRAKRNICCNACHLHSQNRFYATEAAANADRAHKGCDCAIIVERISQAQFNKIFPVIMVRGLAQRRLVFDQRWA